MRTLFKIPFIALFILSCNSQNEMDLAELNLSVASDVLLNKKNNTKEHGVYPGYTIYQSKDPNLLVFNGEKINGSLPNEKKSGENYMRFYTHNENNNVSLIEVRSFVSKKTQLLHKGLMNKFGVPDYFKSVSFASYSVWENRNTKNIYLYEHNYGGKSNGVPVERGILYIIDMKDQVLLDHHTKATYSFYMDYLDDRKTKTENYTYRQFAIERSEDGVARYLKAIEKPVEH